MEKNMRRRVIRLTKPLDGKPVENRACGPGTPDVNYTLGWIELKEVKEWPKNGGPLRVPHYTAQQKVWAIRRIAAHGIVWLLLKVGREWLLLDGGYAARRLGLADRRELMENAVVVWDNGPDKTSLCKALASVPETAIL